MTETNRWPDGEFLVQFQDPEDRVLVEFAGDDIVLQRKLSSGNRTDILEIKIDRRAWPEINSYIREHFAGRM